ncbi:acetylcholine receptor subunit alpha-1-A-like [Anticarsia gemmatalis]|uniref:acetylcholine receptor subunit alpha-1-A-like n=1 Tax=Anticarsia gemmatalis TaxID=129554 RepID=UPI003F769943
MELITYILLLVFINVTVGNDCPPINDVPREYIWEKELVDTLKKDYQAYEPPIPTCEDKNITITLRFILKYFNFESESEKLVMQTWMFISWDDFRLKWKPEDHGGLEEVEVSSTRIWTPGVRLYNNADSTDFDRYFYSRCTIKYSGKVLCVPRVTHESVCKLKLQKFPYDVQECSLIFGTWQTRHEVYKMNVSSRAISMWGVEYGSQWLISDYKQETHEGTEKQLTMTFSFEREAVSLATVIIDPCLIISVLTIVCMFLDVRGPVRLMLAFFSVLTHYDWLPVLASNLPVESADPPNILLYYRGSTILTALMLLITFVLGVICRRMDTPHNVILSINSFVYETYARYFVFPKWDIEDKFATEKEDFNEDWVKFANCVNSLCRSIIIITYIGLYIGFVPQPVPINY